MYNVPCIIHGLKPHFTMSMESNTIFKKRRTIKSRFRFRKRTTST